MQILDAEVDPVLHVVAGVLVGDDGRVLLAQRLPGRQHAGLWEFPGGKLEPGETPRTALRRELHEELGIDIGASAELIRVPQAQPGRTLWLDVLQVTQWQGRLRGREGQALNWQSLAAIDPLQMPPADRPALALLREPHTYWITPPQIDSVAELERLLRCAAAGGAQRLQLRLPGFALAQLQPLAERATRFCTDAAIELLLNVRDRPTLALAAALGIGAQLAQPFLLSLQSRPERLSRVGASCHDRDSLQHAERIGCDFCLLSPVQRTMTHPDANALGWSGFAALRAHTALPVYAMGGLGPVDLSSAWRMGAHGVAGIRGFWSTD
jgi:8-oxo-dGTP diphosphatase